MQSLQLSFSVVCPLFLLMALGYLMRRIGWWDEPFALQLNKISYRVFFSTYLFTSVYNTDLSQAFNKRLMLYALGSTLFVFLLTPVIALLCCKNKAQRGVVAQGMARSNTLLFGLPMVVTLCGEAHAGAIALVIAAIVPLYNILSVILLELFRGGVMRPSKILRQVITNPLVIGAATAIVFLLLGIQLPGPVNKVVNDIGRIATPLSLMILGGTFRFESLKGNKMTLFGVCLAKLVLIPMGMIGLGVLVGLRGIELAVLLALFATPAASSSFTMAEQMGGDYELAGQIIVFSTAFSVLTVFLWVFVLLQTGLLRP